MNRENVLAIIDPYLLTPALNCYERIRSLSPFETRYYQPSKLNLQRLKQEENIGYILLGSAAHVYENHPWQEPLVEILMDKLHQGFPVLGICYGHQVMTHFLGGQVGYYDPRTKTKLTGTREVIMKQSLFDIPAGATLQLAYSHKQIVTQIPLELESLAQSTTLQLDFEILRHKKLPFLSTQAHVETNPSFADLTAKIYEKNVQEKSAIDGEKIIRGFFKYYF